MTRLNSTAVMQRRIEDKNSLDDFPTPPWATRALCEYLTERGYIRNRMTCREPSANRGYMVRTLEEFFDKVEGSDIFDYGEGYDVKDFLTEDFKPVAWTITNPPFKVASEFVNKAFDTSEVGVAVLLRIAFLEGKRRYEELFRTNPPSLVLQFVERVPMVKGKYDPDASSATAYAWFVWLPDGPVNTRLDWIPPCKERLIKPEKDFK